MYFTIIICVVSALLAWWYRRPQGFPPGPRGIPIFGIIPFMTRRPEVKFYQWSKQYGPIISCRVGRQDIVILNSYDAVVEAMLRQGQKFLARPPNYVMDVVLCGRERGVLFSSGKIWEVNRKFGNAVFRSIGVGKRSFESAVQKEVDFLLKIISEKTNIALNWRLNVQRTVSNVICRVIFGKRFDYDDPIFNNALETMTGDPQKAWLLNLTVLMPYLRHVPPVSTVISELIYYRDDAYGHYREEIANHRSKLDPTDVQDFIDAFFVEQIREKEEIGQNEYFTDEQLPTYISELFSAGSETSSTAILWSLLSFLHFPQYQERIRAEIQSIIGKETPSMNHRDSMPFTQAYIHEILRYCTLTPMALPHCTTEDVKLNGYKIPKGTQVMVNLWAVHNDPEDFKNPDQFRPERFLDSDGNFVHSSHVIPFLVGPRHCLGEQLARMEIFIFLTSILQRFKIEPDLDKSNQLPRMDDGVLGVVFGPKPFKAIFVPCE